MCGVGGKGLIWLRDGGSVRGKLGVWCSEHLIFNLQLQCRLMKDAHGFYNSQQNSTGLWTTRVCIGASLIMSVFPFDFGIMQDIYQQYADM